MQKTTPPPLPSPRTTCHEMFLVPTHNTSTCYLGLLRVTNINTRLMAIRRSFSEVIANIASWALFSRGNTAKSHQYQAGPLGLLCKGWKNMQLCIHQPSPMKNITFLLTFYLLRKSPRNKQQLNCRCSLYQYKITPLRLISSAIKLHRYIVYHASCQQTWVNKIG